MRYILIYENHSDLSGDYFFLRKEPKYLDLFKELKEKEGISLEELENIYDDIRVHKNTIKEYNLDKRIMSATSLEDIQDIIQESQLIEKTNKFIKLLPSHLRNDIKKVEDNYNKFKDFVVSLDYDSYKNEFSKKLSKYRNTEDLFLALSKFFASKNMDLQKLIKKIESRSDIEIFYINVDLLIAIVYSKKASCDFGSSQWCISGKEGTYWDSYVNNRGESVQYFIWNFDQTGSNRQIGVTYRSKRDYDAHDSSDRAVRINSWGWSSLLKTPDEISDEKKLKYIIYNKSSQYSIDGDVDIRKILSKKDLSKYSFSLAKRGIINLTDKEILNVWLNDFDAEYEEIIYYLKDRSKSVLYDNLMDILNIRPDLIFKIEDDKLPENLDKEEFIRNKFPEDTLMNIDEHSGDISIDYIIDLVNEISDKYKNNTSEKASNSTKEVKHKVISLIQIYIENYLDVEEQEQGIEDILFGLMEDYSLPLLDFLLKDISPSRVVQLYESRREAFEFYLNNSNIFISNGSKTKKVLENWLNNESNLDMFRDRDIFIFNGRYVKKEAGVNPRNGKTLYEEVLQAEKILRLTPFSADMIQGIRMRANMHEDLSTYAFDARPGQFSEEFLNTKEFRDLMMDKIDEIKYEY